MPKKNVFNRGLALEKAFCNRTAETTQLVKNLENLTHTFINVPARLW